MVFLIERGGARRWVNTEFVVHVEEVIRRGGDGAEARLHMAVGPSPLSAFDEDAGRIFDWYEAQAKAPKAAKKLQTAAAE